MLHYLLIRADELDRAVFLCLFSSCFSIVISELRQTMGLLLCAFGGMTGIAIQKLLGDCSGGCGREDYQCKF